MTPRQPLTLLGVSLPLGPRRRPPSLTAKPTPRRLTCTTTTAATTPSPPTLDTSPAAASHAATTLQHTLSRRPPQTRTQHIDPHALQKLSLLLARPNLHPHLRQHPTAAAGVNVNVNVQRAPPPPGTPLPPGYHLVYFTPAQLEAELGADGTDAAFNAPAPFTRRMWAGGRVEWEYEREERGRDPGQGVGGVLRVGEEVEETTRVVGADGKKARDGRGMVVVEVEKVLRVKGGKGTGRIADVRSWIFRPPVEPSTNAISYAPLDGTPITKSRVWDVPSNDPSSPFPERHMHWSPVALFGFSALTYNAHMIHYNESWTRNVEGHPGLVVHGPLNLINMLDYWRDIHGSGGGLRLRSINYRAIAPLYAGEPYRITSSVLEADHAPRYEVLVKKGDTVCMRGVITAEKVPSS